VAKQMAPPPGAQGVAPATLPACRGDLLALAGAPAVDTSGRLMQALAGARFVAIASEVCVLLKYSTTDANLHWISLFYWFVQSDYALAPYHSFQTAMRHLSMSLNAAHFEAFFC
jgi:hypothetical protein